jgi:hypothetical protein
MAKQLQDFAKSRQAAVADQEKTASAKYLEQMAAEPGATKAPTGYIVGGMIPTAGPT